MERGCWEAKSQHAVAMRPRGSGNTGTWRVSRSAIPSLASGIGHVACHEANSSVCTAHAALPTSYYGRVTLPCKLRLDADVIPQQTTQSSSKFRLCIAFHHLFDYSQAEPSNFLPTEGCREVSCASRCTLQARYKHRGTEGA